jgi:hypothetical protein
MDARIDVIRAISEAIDIVSKGKHDPMRAHERVRTFYNWENVTERTEKVYEAVMMSKQMDLCKIYSFFLYIHHLSPFVSSLITPRSALVTI